MFIGDIKRVVEQVSRDKGIDRQILIQALEEALSSAARKKYGAKIDIEANFNDETGEIEVFQFKEVVEDVDEPDLQISLAEGRLLDPDCEVGDSLGTKMDATSFGRIAAQSAKQVIIQKLKDAERDAVYSNFIDRKGEIINGIVQRFDRGDIIVNLGATEAVLPVREQVPRESYRRGDRIRALILDVLYETRGPQVVLTRTHPDFLVMLFKTEVPEIAEGIVDIKGAAREPGSRAKFAVSSQDSDIDPVGACVGMKGSRVQNVVQELRGEKIDIIPWHVDSAKYVCNALAPAEISRVIIDEESRAMEVIVPDEFLSVAIGKRGQNVRLASKLTGWHLDVNSETQYNETMKSGYDSLVKVSGVGIGMADALFEKGLYSAEELATAEVDDLVEIRGVGEEKAKLLIEAAQEAVEAEKQRAVTEATEQEEQAAEAAEAPQPSPSDADAAVDAETVEVAEPADDADDVEVAETADDADDADADEDAAQSSDEDENQSDEAADEARQVEAEQETGQPDESRLDDSGEAAEPSER